jgi:hypothetical protein
MQTVKAKREADVSKPALARAEILDKATRARFESELEAALKRRPAHEGKLAGALRAIAPMSPALRASMAEAVALMLKRNTLQRELYGALFRTLAEMGDKSVPSLLRTALQMDDAGGTAALCAACFSGEAALTAQLAKLAGSRQSHLAFGAELARVARGESNGAHLTSLAPMIKESHRIAMCVELFVPLVRRAPVPVHVGPALTVLRGAERHLGRWLVLGEVAVRAGDRTPLDEAKSKSDVGPSSARAAWSLVSWALEQTKARAAGAPEVGPPTTRPTLELVARLSDRPSADRDTTFLFRMAAAGASVARPMLETFIKQLPLADEMGVRAALYLARDHGREDMFEALVEAATTSKRDELRGLAGAALWDASVNSEKYRARAREIADDLVASRTIGNVAWGAMIRAAARLAAAKSNGAPSSGVQAKGGGAGGAEPLVMESPYRWVQWGWLE